MMPCHRNAGAKGAWPSSLRKKLGENPASTISSDAVVRMAKNGSPRLVEGDVTKRQPIA